MVQITKEFLIERQPEYCLYVFSYIFLWRFELIVYLTKYDCMKRILLLCALFCGLVGLYSTANGQVQYLDTYFNVIPNSTTAKYTREIKVINDSTYHVVTNYISGEMMMSGTYSDAKLNTPNGDFKYFYANGVQESEGRYNNGLKVGSWKRWSFDGIKKPDRYYPDENFKAKTRSTNPAKFPGGITALQKLIVDSLHYPEEAIERKLEGTVYVTFIVDATGEVSHPQVSEGNHYLLNEEALRFISSLPTWTPATKNGIPVDSSFIMPLTFRINNQASQNNSQRSKAASTVKSN